MLHGLRLLHDRLLLQNRLLLLWGCAALSQHLAIRALCGDDGDTAADRRQQVRRVTK